MMKRSVPIRNRRGLHARASAKLVKLAEQYDAKITIEKVSDKEGESASESAPESVRATSIMGLMMLSAAYGAQITLRAEGREAQAALDALEALIINKFDEE